MQLVKDEVKRDSQSELFGPPQERHGEELLSRRAARQCDRLCERLCERHYGKFCEQFLKSNLFPYIICHTIYIYIIYIYN